MRDNTILYDNVSDMITLLKEVKDATLEQALKLLNISVATYSRWKTNDNTKQSTIHALFKSYNILFVPTLNNENDLKAIRISNMALKNPAPQRQIERFYGNYYIYYFSDHYKNEVHGGMLRIYNNEGADCIKMVNGIRDPHILASSTFLNLFSTNTDSLYDFEKFKDSLPYLIDKRCYYYSGHVSIQDDTFSFYLSGTEHRSSHTQFGMFDLQRVNVGIDKGTGNIRQYRGGLGLVVSPSNAQHRNIRAYRIGISRWKIDYGDPELFILLNHTITDYARVIVSEENDRRWYDLIVRYENN